MGLSSSNQNTPGQINTLTSHTHTLKHTILFVFSRISAPTHHCGLAQLGGKKMADRHGNGLCRSATAVMYVVTLLTLW